MAILLQVYLYGCLISLLLSVWTMRDQDGNINWTDLWISLVLAVCSWSAVLGIGLGHYLKRK